MKKRKKKKMSKEQQEILLEKRVDGACNRIYKGWKKKIANENDVEKRIGMTKTMYANIWKATCRLVRKQHGDEVDGEISNSGIRRVEME